MMLWSVKVLLPFSNILQLGLQWHGPLIPSVCSYPQKMAGQKMRSHTKRIILFFLSKCSKKDKIGLCRQKLAKVCVFCSWRSKVSSCEISLADPGFDFVTGLFSLIYLEISRTSSFNRAKVGWESWDEVDEAVNRTLIT